MVKTKELQLPNPNLLHVSRTFAGLTRNSSASTNLIPCSTSSGKLQFVMDQKKMKRMRSNRESARRSRMRKQKHLKELVMQVAQLRDDNLQLIITHKTTTQQYLALDAENCGLRAQVMELTTRMETLNEIAGYMNVYLKNCSTISDGTAQALNSLLMPWNLSSLNQAQPIMAFSCLFPY